ncbi:MAG: hypothetical protein VB021_08960 [Oscillospiraceae bacterium]|nr:hypothetical protein [Oscillospiraceae bacterium]
MADNEFEKRIAGLLTDVDVPPALEPSAVSQALPSLARRVRRRRTRRIAALAACFVVLCGASAALVPLLAPKGAAEAVQYNMTAGSADGPCDYGVANDALPESPACGAGTADTALPGEQKEASRSEEESEEDKKDEKDADARKSLTPTEAVS